MKMSPELMLKIERGDALTDEELVVAQAAFKQGAEILMPMGPKFHFAWVECQRRADELASYMRHRKDSR